MGWGRVGWSSPAEAAALGSVFTEAWALLEDTLVLAWSRRRCGPAWGDMLCRRNALLSYFSTLGL